MLGPETADDGDGEGWVPFQPRELVWHTIRSLLNPPEVEEVKRVLGTAVIDRNEVCSVFFMHPAPSSCVSETVGVSVQELYVEILALNEIVSDLAAQNEAARVRDILARGRRPTDRAHGQIYGPAPLRAVCGACTTTTSRFQSDDFATTHS